MNVLAMPHAAEAVQLQNEVPWWRTALGPEEIEMVVESIRAEHISGGPVTAQLEQAIGATLGVPYVVCTTSGSMALTLAMMILGVGHGDEVIVPNRTFMATAHAALMLGAKIRLVDVRPDIPAMDTDQLEAAVTPRTKAIVAVHLNGRATDMKAVNEIARRHGVAVVEDAAQAFLSKTRRGWLGAQSDLGCYSLGMTKLVSTGQGGSSLPATSTSIAACGGCRTMGWSTRWAMSTKCPPAQEGRVEGYPVRAGTGHRRS